MEEKPAELPASPLASLRSGSQGGPVSPQETQIQSPSFLDKIKVNKFKILGGIFGMLVLAGAVLGAYKLGQRQIRSGSQPTPTPTAIVTVTPTPGPTANWKTYTNTKYSYEIKYPADFEIDITREDSPSFYRKDVVVSGGGTGRGRGMTIYFRNYGSEAIETQSRPTENTSIAGYPALRWTDNEPCQEDIWISNPSKKNTIRIFYTTCWEKEPYNKVDLEVLKQMLSTFKFLE